MSEVRGGVGEFQHLFTQPLLTGDSAASFSDSELQDLLSCQEPTRGCFPVSELFLRATMGPGPDPRLSELTLGASGSFPESVLVRLPFRLSEEETWLICPSRSSAEKHIGKLLPPHSETHTTLH